MRRRYTTPPACHAELFSTRGLPTYVKYHATRRLAVSPVFAQKDDTPSLWQVVSSGSATRPLSGLGRSSLGLMLESVVQQARDDHPDVVRDVRPVQESGHRSHEERGVHERHRDRHPH
jgi:hypothetical protein